jgi:hypothetical protein
MKLMTFAAINDLDNGQQIPAMQGTIKKVFDQKTGVGDYGPWHLQNIILQDDHANKLTVTWTCPDPWEPKDEGKHLLFESGHDKKDQLVGIKREIKNKNGKRYEIVKVDDRAKVQTLITPNNAPTEQRDTPIPDPDWPEAEKPDNSDVNDARKHIMQSANLYVLCVNSVNKYIAAHLPEIAQTTEMFQAATGTLFIEASMAGYVQKMPETPLK